jgi:predicted MFS family arabinose efflux permease
MQIDTSARRAAAVAMLLVAGVLAGAQLGKIAPLIGWYRAEAGMSLVVAGWLTSAIGFFVAVAALPAAFAVDRFGMYRSFVLSSATLAVGAVALALLDTPVAVLAARLVEGLGYLVLVIATPALLAALPPPRLRAPALAIWGGFVPIGFAVSDFLASVMLGTATPRAFLLTIALIFTASAIAAALLARGLEPAEVDPDGSGAAAHFRASFSAPIVLSALAFGAYVVLSMGFFSFLPTFVAERGTLLVPAWLVALFVPAGNVLTGFLVKGRSAGFVVRLGLLGFAVTAASVLPFYTSADPASATVAALFFALAHGLVASAIFAAVPLILPVGGSTAIAIGIIAQTGGISTLIGPPAAGYVIGTYGWAGFGVFMFAVSVAGLLLMAPMLVRQWRPA